MASGDATFHPLINTAYRAYFPIIDADGDGVADASGLDSEISIDGATAIDCTNEATFIVGTGGGYYLEYTVTEMNCSGALSEIKSTLGKPTYLVFYPMQSSDYGSAIEDTHTGVSQASILAAVAQASVVAGVAQASVVAGVAQASAVAVIDTNYAQASTVAGVAQASAVAVIDTNYAQASTVAGVAQASATAAIIASYAQASALVTTTDIVAQVASVVTTQYDLAQASELGAISAADVWDAMASTYDTSDTMGDLLNTAGAGGLTASQQTQITNIEEDTADIQPNYAQASVVAGVAQASSLTTVSGNVDDIETNYAQASTVAGVAQASLLAAIDTASAETIVDLIWDEELTGATHNVAKSAGRRIREIENVTFLESGTLASATSSTVELPGTSNSNNDWYTDAIIVISKNTGVGQARHIDGYTGSTKVMAIDPVWITTPDNTSEYAILAFSEVHVHEIASKGLTGITQDIDGNSSVLAAILVDTANIQPNYAAASTVAGVAQASTITAIAQASTVAGVAQASSLTTVDGRVTGVAQASAIAALNNLSAANVKTQVVAALNTDTYAEAAAVPSATATLVDKIGYMATVTRNKMTSTSALMTIYADDEATTVSTSIVSDDGTIATVGEFS